MHYQSLFGMILIGFFDTVQVTDPGMSKTASRPDCTGLVKLKIHLVVIYLAR